MENFELSDVEFFVEANSFEQFVLWKEYHELIDWKQHNGQLVQICNLTIKKDNNTEILPVTVSFTYSTIGKSVVCFYYASSRIVDYNIIENFIENFNLKYDNNTRNAKTDAQNFHHCYHFCLENNNYQRIKKLEKILN